MLSSHVDRYVQIHRKLGLQFTKNGWVLMRFTAYAAGDTHLQADRIKSWCLLASSQRAAREYYGIVRRFAIFMNAEDVLHEVPPAGLFGRGQFPRPTPHIFRREDIAAIMQEALLQPPKGSICPHTFHHLYGLLAATGLRISEALGLTFDDVTKDGLIIRNSKNGRSRLVPLHETTWAALNSFLVIRKKIKSSSNNLFIVSHGQAPTATRAHVVFVKILRRLGLREPSGRGPRLHDLRHTFAAHSLEQCPHDPVAVAKHITALSTYLGHATIEATYWYLEATPVLLNSIARANELLSGGETT